MAEITGTSDFAEELRVAREAAAEAAELLRDGVPSNVREKSRADLVTEVDEAAERVILARIRRHFPEDAVVAEESAAGAERGAGRTWVIDPLDGTANFVHRHPFACVSIALVDAEGPAVGVVHAPFLDEVYHAARGAGAYLNERRLRVSGVTAPEAGLYATGFPFKEGKGDPDRYFRLVAEVVTRSHGVRRAGSAALDCAYVAAGRLEGYFETGVSPWDVAAGLALVLEAGGQISSWPRDAESPVWSGRVLASNGHVHAWLEGLAERSGV